MTMAVTFERERNAEAQPLTPASIAYYYEVGEMPTFHRHHSRGAHWNSAAGKKTKPLRMAEMPQISRKESPLFCGRAASVWAR